MSAERTPMPLLGMEKRRTSFEEVALGYDLTQAQREASRCLHCKNAPCVGGCPVGVPIPTMMKLVSDGDLEGAYRALSQANCLPAVCGRVCPQERQCEGKCTRGIRGEAVAVGRIERFVADFHAKTGELPPKAEPNGKHVAVVGSGPAGLACAGELSRRGYAVTVFEALHEAGGVLVYGIPAFRLPRSVVAREVGGLEAMGVVFKLNSVVGRMTTAEELLGRGFGAVFLGTGAGLPRFAGIPGENARGVFSANEYLTRINLMRAYEEDAETPVWRARRVAVVGGGNVAMDAARCAVRMGAEEVTVVYRRGREELPARREEAAHAEEEGVKMCFLTAPTAIETDGSGAAAGLRCVKMELGEADASGRRSPIPVAGSEFFLPSDCVIMALGTSPNPLVRRAAAGLALGRHGEVLADEDGRTSVEGVFAGGDAVTGSATVIMAMGAGKRAAAAIDTYLSHH